MFPEKLLIVSGKGGVGKTALASALATISAEAGTGETMLVTLDGPDDVHPFFETPLGYEPRRLGRGLSGMSLDGNEAIREYATRKIPFAPLYQPFLKSRMFRDFTEAAPGFQEIMALGKIYDLVSQAQIRRVVLDAPATGHLRTLLDVPAATLAAVHVGPLNHNARRIQDMLLDPERTRVVLAALPEEMALREAQELIEFCAERRMNAGPVVVNQRVAERFSADELVRLEGVQGSPALAQAVAAARAEAALAAVQGQALAAVGQRDTLTVPRLCTHEPRQLLEQIVVNLRAELTARA